MIYVWWALFISILGVLVSVFRSWRYLMDADGTSFSEREIDDNEFRMIVGAFLAAISLVLGTILLIHCFYISVLA